MNTAERLRKTREYLGLTQKELGERLGFQWHKIKDIEAGKLKLTPEIAEQIDNFYSIDGWWLLTGKGEMLLNDENSPIIPNTSLSKDVVFINYYEDIYASAGLGSYTEDCIPVKMEFDKNFLEQFLNVRRFDNLDIIRVTGDSMLPYIKDGEFIIVERGSDAKSGDTVIANIDGELYVKRLKKVPFEKWLILESENHDYSPIELNTMAKLQAFTIIGIMRSKIKLY